MLQERGNESVWVHYDYSWFQKWRSHTNLRSWAFSTLNGFTACSISWTADAVLSFSQRYGSNLAASSISFNSRFTSKSPMNRVHRVLNAIKDLALVTQRAESAVHSKHDIRLRQHWYYWAGHWVLETGKMEIEHWLVCSFASAGVISHSKIGTMGLCLRRYHIFH